MEDSKTVFYSSKFPWACEKISSTVADSLDMCPQKRFASPALEYTTRYGKKVKKFKDNWIHHLLLCVDEVNLLGRNINSIQRQHR
jgi:hypothetical protein